jgi:hypothetical protein
MPDIEVFNQDSPIFNMWKIRKQLKVAESIVLHGVPGIFRLKKYEFKREGTTFVVKWRMF